MLPDLPAGTDGPRRVPRRYARRAAADNFWPISRP
jgi:hypothetical protein